MSLEWRAQKCLWCIHRAIGTETELMKRLRGIRFKMMSTSVKSNDGHISRTHCLTTKTSALCSTATMSALTNKANSLKLTACVPIFTAAWRCSRWEKQYRQWTFYITLRRARAIIVAVERQQVLHILSVCL